MREYKELFKNTGLLIIGNIGSKMVSFLLIPLYTSYLLTSEYGIYDVLVTTESLLIPVLTLDIGDGIFRYIMDKNYMNEDVIHSGRCIWVRGVVVSILLATVASMFFSTSYCVFICTAFIIHSLYSILNNLARALDRVSIVTLVGIVNTVSFAILSIIFLAVFKMGLNGYLIAYVVGYIIPTIIMIILLRDVLYFTQIERNKKLTTEMLKYSVPLILVSISWWVISGLDRYMVTIFCGTSANGIYSVAYKIPNIIATFMNLFSQAWVISAIKDNNTKFIKKTYHLYSISSFCLSILIIVFNKLIASILYSEDFFVAWKMVPCLVISCVFQGLTTICCGILTAEKKSKSIMVASCIGACLNFLLNLLLIQIVGKVGAAYATMVSYCIIWILLLSSVKKATGTVLVDIKEILRYFTYPVVIIASFHCFTTGIIIGMIVIGLTVISCYSDILVIFDKIKIRFIRKNDTKEKE